MATASIWANIMNIFHAFIMTMCRKQNHFNSIPKFGVLPQQLKINDLYIMDNTYIQAYISMVNHEMEKELAQWTLQHKNTSRIPKGWKKQEKVQQGVHNMTKFWYPPVQWTKCKLVMVQMRSHFDKHCALKNLHTKWLHFSSVTVTILLGSHFSYSPWAIINRYIQVYL